MDPEILDLVRSAMGTVRVPGPTDKVYKDECGFSFATPDSQGGLYINLATFQAFSEEWVDLDQRRTGQVLYLHERGIKVRVLATLQESPPSCLQFTAYMAIFLSNRPLTFLRLVVSQGPPLTLHPPSWPLGWRVASTSATPPSTMSSRSMRSSSCQPRSGYPCHVPSSQSWCCRQ